MLHQIERCTLLSEFDWSRTQKIFNHLWNISESGVIDHLSYHEDAYQARIYSIGDYGGLIHSEANTNGSPWKTWTGALLEKCLPWSQSIKTQIIEAGLNFVNFSFTRHSSNISRHIDGKTDSESCQGHCNINFIVKTNSQDSYTWIENYNGARKTYFSIAGQAWLLQTDLPHGVENDGIREVFQIKIHSPFQEVFGWLQNHPELLDADRNNF